MGSSVVSWFALKAGPLALEQRVCTRSRALLRMEANDFAIQLLPACLPVSHVDPAAGHLLCLAFLLHSSAPRPADSVAPGRFPTLLGM